MQFELIACVCGGVLESTMIVLAIVASWIGSYLVNWFHHKKCCGQRKLK